MRAYSDASQESLRARDLVKDWADEGFLTEAQHQRMLQETDCELRRTNIFLRLVLFLFTLIIVSAAVALCFLLFSPHREMRIAVFLLIFAVLSYAAGELAVSKARLYRYGIEEALAACSIGFLCTGMWTLLSSGQPYSPKTSGAEFLVPAAGAMASLWLWHRFGLPYAPLAAMVFVLWLPGYWTSAHSAQHLIVVAFYLAGLLAVAAIRSRHRFTYLNFEYSIGEALLWLGIYLAMNLQLSSLNLLGHWRGDPRTTTEVSRPFYWATWVLMWCLPPIVLARGVNQKDRLVIAVGAIVSTLTLVTNKPYLGWQRHTWDPMLMGALLMGVAFLIRHWLAGGPGEIRFGFTARRLSGRDKSMVSVAAGSLGIASPSIMAPGPEGGGSEFRFGGGDFGGGGASSDF